MTCIHRDTIMRLGVRIGKGCERLLDAKMRDLECDHIQIDELWGFVGKKQKHIRLSEDPMQYGDTWTFCAIDSDTKLVPSFKVGKRDSATANAFLKDLAGRMRNRVQLSSDALAACVEAVERAFGTEVDYGQIVKSYETGDEAYTPERKYSPPKFVTTTKYSISGASQYAPCKH